MQTITLYIGLDVHKDSITVAIAEPLPKGEIRLFGTIANSLQAVERTLTTIRKAHPAAHLEVAYEAGPCGFGIARRLKQLGVSCLVAAPSLIPKQPGAPFKTDQRDARSITRLLRAGELTAVYVPEPTDEAIRDLCRARTDAVDDQRRCRLRLKSFLLRHGYRYQGKANWSEAHMRYLRELVLPHPAMKAILEESGPCSAPRPVTPSPRASRKPSRSRRRRRLRPNHRWARPPRCTSNALIGWPMNGDFVEKKDEFYALCRVCRSHAEKTTRRHRFTSWPLSVKD